MININLNKIKESINNGKRNTKYRFALNSLSSTPFVGGIIAAFASLSSEKEQEEINDLIYSNQFELSEKMKYLENKKYILSYIKLNPNTMEVHESYNISSISDLGKLNFNINFITSIDGYLLQYYGDKYIDIQIYEEKNFINFKIKEPSPNSLIITLFNKNF